MPEWFFREASNVFNPSSKMDELLDRCGGREPMLGRIEREFFLDEPAGNEDMRRYFRGLLFRDGR